MAVEAIPTPSAPPARGPYSPAVRAGEWIVLAGQIGVDGDGVLVAGGIESEARQVLANIAAVLRDCEVGWGQVAKVGIFLTDLGNFGVVNALYEEAIGEARPARSTAEVQALPAGAQIEIECWVHDPASERPRPGYPRSQ